VDKTESGLLHETLRNDGLRLYRLCPCVVVSIACNVNNDKQVHVDFDTGPTYHVTRRRAPGSSQHRLSVVRTQCTPLCTTHTHIGLHIVIHCAYAVVGCNVTPFNICRNGNIGAGGTQQEVTVVGV